MNSLRETGYIICVVMVITGIFMMIMPSGNTVKSVKFSLHLFLIISIISPLFNVKADFSLQGYEQSFTINETYDNLTELYNKEIIKGFENEIELTVKAILKKYGITPHKIQILTNVNENNSIDITNIILTLKKTDKDITKALNEINSTFSVNAEVIERE